MAQTLFSDQMGWGENMGKPTEHSPSQPWSDKHHFSQSIGYTSHMPTNWKRVWATQRSTGTAVGPGHLHETLGLWVLFLVQQTASGPAVRTAAHPPRWKHSVVPFFMKMGWDGVGSDDMACVDWLLTNVYIPPASAQCLPYNKWEICVCWLIQQKNDRREQLS